MWTEVSKWWRHVPRRRGTARRLWLERLEDRTLLSSNTFVTEALPFTSFQTAHVGHFLADPREVDLYAIQLNGGDSVHVAVSAQTSGSGLQSQLRVFGPDHSQVALDDQEGGDPQLTFQAAAGGVYFVGVSSAGNDAYDPNTGAGTKAGTTTGLYALDVRRTAETTQLADLTGGSFRLTSGDTAVWGASDPLSGSFTVENRGGATASSVNVELAVSNNPSFSGSSVLLPLQNVVLNAPPPLTLASGADYSTTFTATLPTAASATAAGFSQSGPVYVGLVITPGANDTNTADKSGVHRGEDWESPTIVTPAPAGSTNLSTVDANLNTQVSGTLSATQVDAYPFTVTAARGSGRLTASLTPTSSTLVPRLTLSSVTGQVLNTSDGGRLVQTLVPGTYILAISAATGAGGYRLTTESVPASSPLDSISVGAAPLAVAVADLNGDGTADLVIANKNANTVSVLLSNGDGSFQPQRTYATGTRPVAVAVADLNDDGRPDLVVTNESDRTVSVLLGNGDGTFQKQQTFVVGATPLAVAVADLNGDGQPDLVVANGADSTVSVLLGNGNGTFQDSPDYLAQHTFAVGPQPFSVVAADLNGDGKPDLVTADYGNGTVSVLLGNGDGTFQASPDYLAQHTFAVGPQPFSVVVADLNGDGKLDLVTANRILGGTTASVLQGNGDGTFQPQHTLTVGSQPTGVTVADVNGDGKPDLVTANFGDNTVSVLLGNGNGSFQRQQTFKVGDAPIAVAVVDVNGDGKPDLVTANQFGNTVSVLLGNGDGSFQSHLAFAVGSRPDTVAVADLNGDGKDDLVVANYVGNSVSVLLGNGDGTFQTQQTILVGSEPDGVAVKDLNGDGKPDLVVANYGANTVSVLLGNGDGTFTRDPFSSPGLPTGTLAVGNNPEAVTVADLRGDGKYDLITANFGDNTVSVLRGNGDGTFQPQQIFNVGSGPIAVEAVDVNNDQKPDLITANFGDNTVSVLLGKGDGTFQDSPGYLAQHTFAVGSSPYALAVADLRGDGKPDLITANYSDNTVSVLLGNGDGIFQTQQTFAVGSQPHGLAVADLRGNGEDDLVAANKGDNTVSLLLGNGNGTFQTQQILAVGSQPVAVKVADLNGDGKSDIIAVNEGDKTVSVLLGNGPFQAPRTVPVGNYPDAVAVADVNGDGRADIAVANYADNTVTVLLGNGDGSFTPETLPVGAAPTSIVVADANGDGKPDVITTNSYDNSVSVLLGNGDGSFQAQQTFAVGARPTSVAVADFNGDGIPDLVTANVGDGTVSVLLGKGDGSFQSPLNFAVGSSASSLAVADVNGDGLADLVVANSGDNTVSVLLGNGDGTFQPQKTIAVGSGPDAVAVADLNGDGKPDLGVANKGDNTVSLLLGNGDGSFVPQKVFSAGLAPNFLRIADVNGDGHADLVLADSTNNTASVLLGDGQGFFQAPQAFALGASPSAVALADVNGDGKADLIVANKGDSKHPGNTISILLGNGAVSFTPSTPASGTGVRNTPQLGDLNGDGIKDSLVLDEAGNILFRRGLPGPDHSFAPPVNPPLNPGRPARDLTLVHLADGWAAAAIDTNLDASILGYTVSLYRVSLGGSVAVRSQAFSTSRLPTRIVAGDLTGNGLDDLVVTNSLDNTIQVAFQQPDGTFSSPLTLPTGEAPADLALVDVNGDGLLDIVVSNQASGDVSVFLNDSSHSFAQSYRFRAGTSLSALDATAATPAIASLEQSVSLAAGDFTGTGRTDLVVVKLGAHTFTVLPNDGLGGFLNPMAALSTSTSEGFTVNAQPGAIVAADFHTGDGLDARRAGKDDVAILMENRGEVWIYTNQGAGTFTHTFSMSVGSLPTGLSVVRNPTTGLFDLLVGNAFGDVLRLQGQGDGTFKAPPPLTGSQVTLAVTGSGSQTRVLVANQQANHVVVETPAVANGQFTTTQTVAAPTTPFAFTDAHWFVLDKNTAAPDAVVVGSASNSLQINRLDAASGTYVATNYAVGTDPVAVTIQDINGDGIPDMLVANQGSNDISVLFGGYDVNGNWVGAPGPRLKVDGSGPNSVAVRDVTGPTGTGGPDGIPDLVVTNSQSGTMTVLPGVGQGFFNDTNPQTISLGGTPGTPSINGDGLGVVPTADGRLVGFDLNNLAGSVHTVFASATPINAVQELPGGAVVVALAGGTVEELLPNAAGDLTVATTFEPLAGMPLEPSALEVLQTASGTEVLVTNAGEDQVFVFAAPGLPEVVLPVASPVANAEAEVTAPPGAPLTLVVTLVGAVVPGDQTQESAAAADSQSGGLPFTNPSPPDPARGQCRISPRH